MHKPRSPFALLFASAILLDAETAIAQQTVKFPVIELNAGMHVIKAEVAIQPEQRIQGLMHREKMGLNEGMIFLFDAPNQTDPPAKICMWMKNTLIPLSVAFIDQGGKIINIEDMAPKTTTQHCAKKPEQVRYALEMNRGWFKQKNIKPGYTLVGLPQSK